MQLRRQKFWEKRSLYYLAKMYADILLVGEHFERLRRCVGISILDFNLTEDGRYLITEKGKRNSAICESSLPYSVRQRSDRNIAAYNKAALRRAQVQSHVTERENGTFTVTLALRDDVDSLMHLELMMADKDSADKLAKRFQKEPEAVYAKVIQALCEE